jgi:hypothetical protein
MDADWRFKADNKGMDKLVKLFKSNLVGGIAETYPVQYPLRENAGLLERGVMIQNILWMEYNQQNGGPLLVNILRKDLMKPTKTLADDFERFNNVLDSGYAVYHPEDPNFPRMITAGEKYTFWGLVKQKERTAIARKQIGLKFGLGFYWFCFKEFFKELMFMDIRYVTGIFLVNLAFIIGAIKSKFRKISTKEGWTMRLR